MMSHDCFFLFLTPSKRRQLSQRPFLWSLTVLGLPHPLHRCVLLGSCLSVYINAIKFLLAAVGPYFYGIQERGGGIICRNFAGLIDGCLATRMLFAFAEMPSKVLSFLQAGDAFDIGIAVWALHYKMIL
jgi:hypothetical protein